jgi:hypothetical protein
MTVAGLTKSKVATPVSVEAADQDPEELVPSLEAEPALDPEGDL